MSRDWIVFAALALLSAATTAQQLSLMQVLGWMHWHHFAYMVVAIALLGFGAAGTLLSLARGWWVARVDVALPWLFLGAALAMPLGVALAQHPLLAVDLPLVFFDPITHAWRLAILCLLLLPPFLLVGLATGLVLTVHASRAGYFYAASLAGAGAGGVLGLLLISQIEPPRLAATNGLLAWGAALLVAGASIPGAARPISTRRMGRPVALAAGVFLVLVGLALLLARPVSLTPSQFKPLARTLDLPGAQIVASQPSVHGWIQIVDAPALRPSPAVGFDYTGEVPVQAAVFVNGLAYGSILDREGARAPGWMDHTTDAVAFRAVQGKRVLLLENGPGGWAAYAKSQGADQVVAAEPNGALVELLARRPPLRAGEWLLPGVHVAEVSGRGFLNRRGAESYAVIRFPTVGELGGSAGLSASTEQFLVTIEAFEEAWAKLSDDGVIAVSVWMEFPERSVLRLLATLSTVAERANVPVRDHLVAVRGWATVTFLLRRSAWSPEDVGMLRAFAQERGFDPLLLPDLRPEEREDFHAWQNPGFFTWIDQLVDGPREALYREYPFTLQPTTDDRPYFSQFFRWTAWDRMGTAFGARALPFFELGSLVVAVTLLILIAMGVVGIVLPIARRGWTGRGRGRVLAYFGGLGAGYMLVEIGLMFLGHAWLGSPVQAAAVVLTSLLLASGAGSFLSQRWIADVTTQRRVLAGLLGGIVITVTVLQVLAPGARSWPTAAQVSALLGIVLPMGLLMGMAMPLGLRRLDREAQEQVPWAWAINGCVSVATPAAAMLLAMNAGYAVLFLGAAGAYGLAFFGVGSGTGPRGGPAAG